MSATLDRIASALERIADAASSVRVRWDAKMFDIAQVVQRLGELVAERGGRQDAPGDGAGQREAGR